MSATSPPSTTITSPVDALRHDEIARTRRFVVLIFVMAVIVAASLPFLGGTRAAKQVLHIGILCVLASGAVLWYAVRSPQSYTEGKALIAWSLGSFGVCAGCFYFGVYSPAAAMLAVGIYFIALGQSRIVAITAFVICVTYQAVASGLVIAGVIPDFGLIPGPHVGAVESIIIQCLVLAIFAAAFSIARVSRRITVAAVTELDRAHRAITRRDVVLEEARDALERARGGPGRLSSDRIGDFILGDLIGRGSMGEVYAAHHAATGEAAAIKLLHAHLVSEPSYVARFLREIELSSAIDSANVVKVIGVSGPRDPVPFLAMELLSGTDLAELLRAHQSLRMNAVVDLVAQCAAGISAATQAGIVHRDLKPQNLFRVDGTGTWKILDFGVSTLAAVASTLTGDHIVGTPAYMAPEQARGEKVDHRVDIYALAAITYRAVTGYPPFRGKDVPATLYKVDRQLPLRPSAVAPVPEDLDCALRIGLAKDPRDRFASAGELAAAVAAAAAGDLRPELRAHAARLSARLPWHERPA